MLLIFAGLLWFAGILLIALLAISAQTSSARAWALPAGAGLLIALSVRLRFTGLLTILRIGLCLGVGTLGLALPTLSARLALLPAPLRVAGLLSILRIGLRLCAGILLIPLTLLTATLLTALALGLALSLLSGIGLGFFVRLISARLPSASLLILLPG